MNCRHCSAPLVHTFIDLGYAPPSNAYLTKDDLKKPEIYYPLKVRFCDKCWLVQTEDYTKADSLFTHDYAYFSSTSSSWLEHAQVYSQRMISELGLGASSHVIEVASNDGYLLKNFVAKGVPCLGIEPTRSTAEAAEKLGIPVRREFFGEEFARGLARDGLKADLIIGNNVYAHVPDINDFTKGLKEALKNRGVITLEFPHVMQLLENSQFDTIYHEHFSYLSLYTVQRVFESVGLRVWKVEELSTHGGSLRVYGCHSDDPRAIDPSVPSLLQLEKARGLQARETYLGFHTKVERIKDDLITFLIQKKREGKRVVAYGAAAKGNTLLNYAGVRSDLIERVFDAAVAKQGKYLPGSHIPIDDPSGLPACNADYVLILPWNIAQEVWSVIRNELSMPSVPLVVAVPALVCYE